MNYGALKSLILNTPALAELAGPAGVNNEYPDSKDESIAILLNTRNIPVNGVVTRDQFTIWSVATKMRSVIQDKSVDVTSPLRDSALALLDVLRGGSAEGVDFSKPENILVLNEWVSEGALTEAHKDYLLSLGITNVSLAEQAGIVPRGVNIHNLDVAFAFGRYGLPGGIF